MHVLEAYCECVKRGDAEGMASLFTDDAIFYDGGFVNLGQPPVSLSGRKAIKDFFKELFSQFKINIKHVVINGNSMRYDICDIDDGSTLGLALGVMKEEKNLIKEYRIEVGLAE